MEMIAANGEAFAKWHPKVAATLDFNLIHRSKFQKEAEYLAKFGTSAPVSADSQRLMESIIRTALADLEMSCAHTEPADEAPVSPVAFWNDIHPLIANVAKSRYETKHFADAVEAALKEINKVIKDHVKQLTNQELDGATLMNTAFSPKNPIIRLEDLSSETGQSIQQGYMHIFAGAMIGIRNPKAHGNLTIDALRARHLIYLASLLAWKFDERIK